MHGKGLLIYSDTSMYDGEFVHGNITGHGIFVWPEGKRYEGQWVDSKMQGTGTMKWANGNKYTGEWVSQQEIYKNFHLLFSLTTCKNQGYKKYPALHQM